MEFLTAREWGAAISVQKSRAALLPVRSSVGPPLVNLALPDRHGAARALDSLQRSGGGLNRLREAWLPLLQAAVAAGLAWFLAHDVLGHKTPIFAPIGALIILSNAPGRRTSRILATTLGAVIGIAIGDLVVSAMGTGAIEVAVVALLAMGVATGLGASPMLVTQAGIAAVLVATIQPPHGIYSSAGVQRLVGLLETLDRGQHPKSARSLGFWPGFPVDHYEKAH